MRSRIRYAGATATSTSVITPSMPTATWAAWSSSGVDSDTSITSPVPVTMRARRRVEENEPRRTPEPCVPVPIAPPIYWVSMSPWFASVSPASHSGSPNAPTLVPASAVAR